MSPLPRQPLADPLLEHQNDRLALSSENALLRQTAELNKLDHEHEAMKEDLKHVVNAYHGADSRATRLDSQNARMVTQLELVEEKVDELEERVDELEEKNSALEEQTIELVRRLAESEREVARLKVIGDKEEAQTVGVKRKREFFGDLVCGMSKSRAKAVEVEADVAFEQDDAVVKEEEERPQKKQRRCRHREGPSNTPGTDAVLEKEADVEETVVF